MSDRDIRALLVLLGDSNQEMVRKAGEALVEYGAAALPALQEFADMNPSLAATLTQRIRAELMESEWLALARQPNAETASLLLAQWLDPLLEPASLSAQLDQLAEPIRGVVPSGTGRNAYRQDAVTLRDWLAEAKGFRGAVEHYYSPENSLLPHVLETRRGIPLALSLVYLFVARRLDAPLYPIGMPRHFIVRYGSESEGIFIDPYHRGVLMTRHDCRRWLMQQGMGWREEFLHPISDYAIIERMLRNLVNAYAQQADDQAVLQVVKYLEIWTDYPEGQHPH